MAARSAPSTTWIADPGWQSLLQVVPLRNLTPDESMTYLNLRTVPTIERSGIVGFTHGHPLAISLVADVLDQQPGYHFEPLAVPNIIESLLTRLIHDAPSRLHRATLEAACLALYMTEVAACRHAGDLTMPMPLLRLAAQPVVYGGRALRPRSRMTWCAKRWPPICAGAIPIGTSNCIGGRATSTMPACARRPASTSVACWPSLSFSTATLRQCVPSSTFRSTTTLFTDRLRPADVAELLRW